jgi:selenide, water dikinase
VYAMGGKPLTALAIAGFPQTTLDLDTIRAIFQGGFDKLREAGVALLGGHTVQDQEIKFGYAITGAIDPERVLSNAGAKPGDVLFLTKPIGTGVIGTAIKFDRVTASATSEAVHSMRTLNRAAAEVLRALPADAAHACTDVTGFGLIGHSTELATASGVTVVIDAPRVPLFDGVIALVGANRSGGLASNRDHFEAGVQVDPGVNPDVLSLLFDPQTSGGLLIAAASESADDVATAMERGGVRASRIGETRASVPGIRVVVRS